MEKERVIPKDETLRLNEPTDRMGKKLGTSQHRQWEMVKERTIARMRYSQGMSRSQKWDIK